MPMFTPENADLLAGQQHGYRVIENNTASQIGRVKELMGRYGSANPEYADKMVAAQMRAQAAAKLKLDARLADSQLRSRMHEFKLKMLQDAYKQQKKDRKTAMWATALGTAGQVGSGIAGMATPSYDYSNGGPLSGESYMDLSGIMRTQG
jgi:hypothetical protein